MMARLLLSSYIFCSVILLTIARDLKHSFEISEKDSVIKRNANFDYTKILNFWKDHKNEFILHGEHKNVVLVVGNTGAGKTTIVSALVGRKLKSVKHDGYVVIVDEDGKIGNGTSSRTLIPEILNDIKRNVTYIDCAGFRDNRDIEHEISSVYFQNILMNQVEKIKLLLIINYESLKINGNKNDFDDLMDHVGTFIKDIPKFYDGIALVATKVDNSYEETDDGRSILTNNDQSVLVGIANFLRRKKAIYLHRVKDDRKYEKFVSLINILLEYKNHLYTRIAIFRQPTRRGLLENLSKTKNEIDTIANMTINNLHYVESKKSDYGFTLSNSLRSTVDRIVDDIFRDALTSRLQKISQETLTHYLQIEEEYSDIGILQKRVSYTYDIFSRVNVDQPQVFFNEFLDAANTLNIPLSLTNLDIISEDIEKLYFFTTLSNSNEDTHMLLLKDKMQSIVNLIKNLKNFYDFLNNMHENLAAYKSQNLRDDRRITNIITSCTSLRNLAVQDVTDLEDIVKEIGSDRTYRKIKTLKLNRFQLKHLKDVFSAFNTKLDISCILSSKQMTVKGYNVRISDVVKTDCWTQAKIVQIFAVNKVFIDCTLNKTGAEMQLSLIALTWEVMGEPKIILDGKAGEPHKKESAKSSSFNAENGANGLPGLPGSPAGHFFGVGKHFINSEYLEIRANGGAGGPGQHGGNGADGIPGEALSDLFFEIKRQTEDLKKYFADHNYKYTMKIIDHDANQGHAGYRYVINVLGKPAIKPSNGGNGGTSGRGGYPGRIVINSLGKLVYIRTSNHLGSTGRQGQGGHGGKKTSEGRRVKFNYHHTSFAPPFSWTAEYYDISWTDGADVPSGKDGTAGFNDYGQKLPTSTSFPSLYAAINAYKDFIRINLFENIKESELRSFINKLENDNHIKAQYTTLAFVEELERLENQFLKLKNKIDLVPFYNSILTRIEEFAKSEKNLASKKVLNYIYTAALTKLFALKKKRKGQTVVDLYMYLNTIETNVKEIREAQHVQIVQKYRDEYKTTLNKKIREAEDFIQNKIEPEIDKLWEESDRQIKAIIDEIAGNRISTKNTLVSLEKQKEKIRHMMELRAGLLPLKLAGAVLSFFGPIGAGVGVGVTSLTSIADGMLLDTISGLGQNKFYSLDPSLKIMSRVTEVFNNKQQLATEKLNKAMTNLEKYEKELSTLSIDNKSQKKRAIRLLRSQLQEAMFRKTGSFSDVLKKQSDIKTIENKMIDFAKSEKDILEKKDEEEKNVNNLKKERKYETALRRINDVQSVLSGAEIVFSFIKKQQNDEGIMKTINDQISGGLQQLKDLEKMENQVYDIVLPDFRHIDKTINELKNSLKGSSHVKLDINKWTVRTTLRDVKSLLQKFTQRMSFELQTNLKHYVEKIDEGFSILIDIYDRIDSYSDSVKQAEYIAHIVSAPMSDIHVTDSELSNAMINLKLIIHSNILLEKYGIALQAFKQHFFPFAAHVLQMFQLPTNMQLIDTESVRSNIIDRIKNMKNHISATKATIGEYSKYIHENKIFNSNTIGSSPFYVWKHDTIKNEVQQLLNGSEILLKADISKGLFYNSIKYNDIGINLKLKNSILQNNLNYVLQNFELTMTMIGNNYYRCGERYYFISFDDDITISYTLKKDKYQNWLDSNEVYTKILNSHTFLSPYVMWSIKLNRVDRSTSYSHLNTYANEPIDIELFGRGYYIEQNSDFNFEVCNEYLKTFYDDEVIIKNVV